MAEERVPETAVTEDQHIEWLVGMTKALSAAGRVKFLLGLAEQMSEAEVFAVLPKLFSIVKDWTLVPHDVFEALLRIRPYDAMEMVLIARDPDEGDAWVYMTRRASNDKHYANLLHVPGSIKRLGDDLRRIVQRLRESEFDFAIPDRFSFVDFHENKDDRGECLGIIYMGEVGMLPENRTNWRRFRDIDHSELCLHHGGPRGIVAKAVEYWRMGVVGDYMVLEA